MALSSSQLRRACARAADGSAGNPQVRQVLANAKVREALANAQSRCAIVSRHAGHRMRRVRAASTMRISGRRGERRDGAGAADRHARESRRPPGDRQALESGALRGAWQTRRSHRRSTAERWPRRSETARSSRRSERGVSPRQWTTGPSRRLSTTGLPGSALNDVGIRAGAQRRAGSCNRSDHSGTRSASAQSKIAVARDHDGRRCTRRRVPSSTSEYHPARMRRFPTVVSLIFVSCFRPRARAQLAHGRNRRRCVSSTSTAPSRTSCRTWPARSSTRSPFERRLFGYDPTQRVTLLLADFSDAGNAAAGTRPAQPDGDPDRAAQLRLRDHRRQRAHDDPDGPRAGARGDDGSAGRP